MNRSAIAVPAIISEFPTKSDNAPPIRPCRFHNYLCARTILQPPGKIRSGLRGYEILPVHRHPGGISFSSISRIYISIGSASSACERAFTSAQNSPAVAPTSGMNLRFLHIPRRQSAVKIINNRHRNIPAAINPPSGQRKLTPTLPPHFYPFPNPAPTPPPPQFPPIRPARRKTPRPAPPLTTGGWRGIIAT